MYSSGVGKKAVASSFNGKPEATACELYFCPLCGGRNKRMIRLLNDQHLTELVQRARSRLRLAVKRRRGTLLQMGPDLPITLVDSHNVALQNSRFGARRIVTCCRTNGHRTRLARTVDPITVCRVEKPSPLAPG